MPTWILPSDTNIPGNTGHTTDHNHIVDDLTLIETAFPGVTTGAAQTAHNTLDDGTGKAALAGQLAMGANKITGLAPGSAATDAAAFGQVPTSAGAIGGLLAANNLSDVGTRQTALNNLAGAVTNNDVLAGNGSNITLRALAAADIPGTLGATTFSGKVTAQGGIAETAIATKTANYTLTLSDHFVIVDSTAGAFALTLPDATTCPGQRYEIKQMNSANQVTLTPQAGQTIDGITSYAMFGKTWAMGLISTGSNWLTTVAQGFTFNNILDDGTVGGATFQGGVTVANTTANGFFVAGGLSVFAGGTGTASAAAVTSPTFVSGTALQVSTAQDVMLYIAIQTSAALAVSIGSTSAAVVAICPSKTYALGLMSIRVPQSWFVKITGTIADLTITAVGC